MPCRKIVQQERVRNLKFWYTSGGSKISRVLSGCSKVCLRSNLKVNILVNRFISHYNKLTYISVAIVILFLIYSCKDRSVETQVNYFRVNETLYSLDNCTLTSGSGDGMLRCEIDLSCCNIGNPYIPTDQIEIRNFIWFSLRCKDTVDLKEGVFICSERKDKLKLPMTFSGTVTSSGTDIRIKRGKLVVQKNQREVKLVFKLQLDNHHRMYGNFTGPFAENVIHN